MPRLLSALVLVSLFLSACAHDTDPAYIDEIDQWHAERIERLTVNDGWLTLVGLHPLHDGINTLGSGPEMDVQLGGNVAAQVGSLDLGADQILFTRHPKVEVRLAGKADHQPFLGIPLVSDTDGVPTVLEVGSLRFHVIERNRLHFLRVKDTEAEVLKKFTGVDRFAVDDRWRITARLEEGPASIVVPNVLGQSTQAPSPGVLVFKVKGKEYRLTPQGAPGKSLFLVFGDDTNGKTTYSGGRFLGADPIGEDGTVVLDFNKSTNPPCVFTPFATCPLPSLDNLLNVAVTAGEMMWGDPH